MMDKKPSSELHLVKYLVLVPFVAASALAFNISKAELKEPRIEVVKLTNTLLTQPGDTLPEKAPAHSVSGELYDGNVSVYGKPATSLSRIAADDPVILDGKETNGRQAKAALREKEISFAAKLENKLARYYLPGKDLVYWLETKGAVKAANRPDFPPPPPVVKQIKFSPANTPPPPVVKQVRFEAKKDTVDDEMRNKEKKNVIISCCTTTAGQKPPLFIVDGVPSKAGIKEMDPNEIASITILKDAKATGMFGKKAENGVVLIVTKENAVKNTVNVTSFDSVESVEIESAAGVRILPSKDNENILYLVDGEAVEAEAVQKIDAEEILHVNVLKDKSATDKYGEKGEHGVIEITTKK